jgi:hypothetical protein
MQFGESELIPKSNHLKMLLAFFDSHPLILGIVVVFTAISEICDPSEML